MNSTLLHLSYSRGHPNNFFQRSHLNILNITSSNMPKVPQIRTNIHSPPMASHPTLHRDPNRAYFLITIPDTSLTFNSAVGGDAEGLAGEDHDVFEHVHVLADGEFVGFEIEDGVSDEYPWAVEGDVPASVCVDDGGVEGVLVVGEGVVEVELVSSFA
uniref:Uncharacterized protein n=1 Tax=Arcella intermedia TaxID=1963864 RepID=A0A6B2LJ74_9EUKA